MVFPLKLITLQKYVRFIHTKTNSRFTIENKSMNERKLNNKHVLYVTKVTSEHQEHDQQFKANDQHLREESFENLV